MAKNPAKVAARQALSEETVSPKIEGLKAEMSKAGGQHAKAEADRRMQESKRAMLQRMKESRRKKMEEEMDKRREGDPQKLLEQALRS